MIYIYTLDCALPLNEEGAKYLLKKKCNVKEYKEIDIT